jgi:hypothetical protein
MVLKKIVDSDFFVWNREEREHFAEAGRALRGISRPGRLAAPAAAMA